MASGSTISSTSSLGEIFFARNFFRALNEEDDIKASNLISSPTAARSAMTLVLMAAGGLSADELRSGLTLGSTNKLEIAKQHAEFLSKVCVCNKKGVSMRLSTGLYVKENQEIRPEFNLNAVEFFNTQADALDFTNATFSLQYINNKMEQQTFRTVREMLSPSIITPDSSVILVNTLYFRGKWTYQFSAERTLLDDFLINEEQKMHVPMMRQVGYFRYGESKKLNSRILQLPFEDSDITMLLILPQNNMGLIDLEKSLIGFDLNEVAFKSLMHEVDVMIPRFKLECEVDLKMPLKKLGITRIFQRKTADLSGLFSKRAPQLISEARQKLSLNVNEAGCGVIDNTPVPITKSRTNPHRKIFKADHPFVFAIRSKKKVYLVGHYIRP